MTTERPVRAQPAVGARIMAAGISVAAGLGLVGAMAVAARPEPAPPSIDEVMTVDAATVEPLPDAPPRSAVPAASTESGGS